MHRWEFQTLVALLAVVAVQPLAFAGTSRRIDVSPVGVEANNPPANGGQFTRLSADGRIVAFDSSATNLLPGDTTTKRDVYAWDRDTGSLTLVSATPAGVAGDSDSTVDCVSPDGRFVLFTSYASDLVPNDTSIPDNFLRDLWTGTTEKISVSDSGVSGNSYAEGGATISADDRYIAFTNHSSNLVPGDDNARTDVFLRDRLLGTTRIVSMTTFGELANDMCVFPRISADGRFVAFQSFAFNLATPDGPATWDILVADALTGAIEMASVATGGAQANDHSMQPGISADGRFVVFATRASNLVGGDTPGTRDVFVRDRLTGTTELISRSYLSGLPTGGATDPQISNDGNRVVFTSDSTQIAPGITDQQLLYSYDRDTQQAYVVAYTLSGQPLVKAAFPALSGDGQWVSYASSNNHVVPGDHNVGDDQFVCDLSRFSGLYSGHAGSNGIPVLTGIGALTPLSPVTIDFAGGASSAPGVLLIATGITTASLPAIGPLKMALPASIVVPFTTSPTGTLAIGFSMPSAGLSHAKAFLQAIVADGTATGGLAISNLLQAELP